MNKLNEQKIVGDKNSTEAEKRKKEREKIAAEVRKAGVLGELSAAGKRGKSY